MSSPEDPSNAFAPLPLAEDTKVGAGRFTLKRILGQGGMGVVWLARDQRLDELVALKFLPPQIRFDSASIASLRRETLRSRKLSHPNIIRIHDLHEPEGEDPFIAMEFVDGPTLSALRLQQPQAIFSWDALAPVVRQLCDALDYAHGEKVIHRDLKPGNLMLDSNARLKLADFGIATVINDSVARISGSLSGTPAYMSPQQMNGQLPQPTDDIYSLGATLYESLTGTPPFHSGQIVHQVLHNPPTTVHERLTQMGLHNEIPPAAEAMIMACLAKDPKQRPQSARAVADWIGLQPTPHPKSLEATLAPSEEEARPAPAQGKKLLLAAAVVLLLLIAAGGWFGSTKMFGKRKQPVQGTAEARSISNALSLAASEQKSEPRLPATAASVASARVSKPGQVVLTEDFENLDSQGKAKAWEWTAISTGQKRSIRAEPQNHFLELESDTESRIYAVREFSVGPQWRALKFSMRIRTRDLRLKSSYAGISLGITWKDRAGARIDGTSLALFFGTADWKTVEGVFGVPLSAASVRISPTLAHATGVADFDDITVSLVEEGTSLVEPLQSSLSDFAALSPEQQAHQVIARLKKLNPGFDGTHFARFERGQVTELSVSGTATNLSPIRSLVALQILHCGFPYPGPHSKLSDLSPLRGLALKRLDCSNSDVSDLSPLQGMPLTALACFGSRVTDLSPLQGMRLSDLECSTLRDLKDLSPLRGMPLGHLRCTWTSVKDLSPLAQTQLVRLECDDAVATNPRNAAILRKITTLREINHLPPAEFWKPHLVPGK